MKLIFLKVLIIFKTKHRIMTFRDPINMKLENITIKKVC